MKSPQWNERNVNSSPKDENIYYKNATPDRNYMNSNGKNTPKLKLQDIHNFVSFGKDKETFANNLATVSTFSAKKLIQNKRRCVESIQKSPK